jgi:pyruvate, orthophosphate dikinase
MELQLPRYIYDFAEPPTVDTGELSRLLGGKGANLVVMANELGMPVPPGFTVTTEACREFLGSGWPAGLEGELRDHMARLGTRVSRGFGDVEDPLLVSVRSGAPVSMPGMMDTILNLGLNDQTARGLASVTGDDEFAADCLRRFRENYRAVIGGEHVPDDPWVQLRAAVEAVLGSWNRDRARAYRRHEGIADDLGTAVTVQAMVFGNRGPDSATGVVFTRNPATGEDSLYGDVMFRAQGEDVVAGTHEPEPIEILDQRMPAVSAELRRHADVLERHFGDLCDIEFTIEEARLWLLQVRIGKRSPRAALRMAIEMAEDPTFPCSREEAVARVAGQLAQPPLTFVKRDDGVRPLTVGLPASPGVASGAIATSPDAAVQAADAGRPAILVRTETSPEDVDGMARAAGVLTARGGLASHAAVVARGWGIPAVVGASQVRPAEGMVEIDGRTFSAGEELTIDGSTGEVYAGALEGSWEVVPEAATLLGWAAEMGIEIAARTEAAPERDVTAASDEATLEALTADDVRRALLVKGTVQLEQLAEALQSAPDEVAPHLEALRREQHIEGTGGTIRLSAEGKLGALALFAGDRERLGEDRSAALLDEFHALDGRMKAIVTAWQVRDVGGEQVINDHSDTDYDERILDDLSTLHTETSEWVAPLADSMRRFAAYSSRLGRAAHLAVGGDQRYVASPRVDSYHSVWFELHEDLIRLAGRRRSE